MKVSHLKEIESKYNNEQVSTIIKEAEQMNYDSIMIIGIKDGEIYSAHHAQSKLQLLGAMSLVEHDFKDINF